MATSRLCGPCLAFIVQTFGRLAGVPENPSAPRPAPRPDVKLLSYRARPGRPLRGARTSRLCDPRRVSYGGHGRRRRQPRQQVGRRGDRIGSEADRARTYSLGQALEMLRFQRCRLDVARSTQRPVGARTTGREQAASPKPSCSVVRSRWSPAPPPDRCPSCSTGPSPTGIPAGRANAHALNVLDLAHRAFPTPPRLLKHRGGRRADLRLPSGRLSSRKPSRSTRYAPPLTHVKRDAAAALGDSVRPNARCTRGRQLQDALGAEPPSSSSAVFREFVGRDKWI